MNEFKKDKTKGNIQNKPDKINKYPGQKDEEMEESSYDFKLANYENINNQNTKSIEKDSKNIQKNIFKISIFTTLLILVFIIIYSISRIVDIDLHSIKSDKKPNPNVPEIYINKNQLSADELLAKGISIPQVVQKVKPSIVGIVAFDDTKTIDTNSFGSGIIISSDGYIVTAHTLIKRAVKIKVRLDNGKEYEAKVAGNDELTDLAIIKIEEKNLISAEFGDAHKMNLGDWALTMGSLSDTHLSIGVNLGIISSLDRTINNNAGIAMKAIQTDALIDKGNSGGGLVNLSGQIIGINSYSIGDKYLKDTGFAISVVDIKETINEIMKFGHVQNRATFDFSFKPIDALMAKVYGISEGVYINNVKTDSESSYKELKKGDLILFIDDEIIKTVDDVNRVLFRHKPGDIVKISYQRANTYAEELIKTAAITLKPIE